MKNNKNFELSDNTMDQVTGGSTGFDFGTDTPSTSPSMAAKPPIPPLPDVRIKEDENQNSIHHMTSLR